MQTRYRFENPFWNHDQRASIAGSNRVIRGGSWNNDAQNCRCANRNRNEPDNHNHNVGFRLVFVPQLTGMSDDCL
jgi:formylglycine-generating enzyme required for sulfatase activity